MAIPNTKATFIDYVLRSLGFPVIEINVAPEQIDDRVDEAMQYFHMFHMDAMDRVFLSHQITADDISNGYITIAEPVVAIINIIWNAGALSTDFASGAWQYQADVFGKLGFKSCSDTSLSDYVISMTTLSNVDAILGNHPRIQYSMHSNKLYIDGDWSRFSIGDYIVYEAYIQIDPDEHVDVWNDMWLKEYAIALVGRQWGSNLQKFQQVELPGGITLNGDAIYDQYNTRIETLREEMDNKYSYPPDMMIG